MLVNKAIKCFTECNRIYGRKDECKQIKEFLKSNEQILHITGSPGTGKTTIVKWILPKDSFLYLNYFNEPKITLNNKAPKIIVFDEFDKFQEERKSECLKFLNQIRKLKKKLITISNDLKMGNIRFKPYSINETEQILKEKISLEIGIEIMDQKCMAFLAKKYGEKGDLRALFKVIVAILSRKNNTIELEIDNLTENQNNKTNMKSPDSTYLLDIKDFITTVKVTESGIHHQIIEKIKNNTVGQKESFKKYLEECEELSLTPLPKTDFNTILEML